MIDLDAVKALQAVDNHGSVIAAADALGFTPSAISQQVKRLERQTGLQLLERVGRGVMLTGSGRHLADSGHRLLAELEQLEADVHRQSSTVAGRVRLTAFSTAMRGLVAPALPALLEENPLLEVALTEREPWDTVDLVATGRCEIGVVHSWGDVPLEIPEHLVTTSIAKDVADVIVPAGHRLATRKRVTPHDLVDEAWIATPDGTICRQWLNRMYDGTGRLPNIAHQSMEFASHLALVAAGLGIALVPRLGRSDLPPGTVALSATRPTPTRDVVALHRRTMTDSPAIAATLKALAGMGKRA